jgi:hypothetical protein
VDTAGTTTEAEATTKDITATIVLMYIATTMWVCAIAGIAEIIAATTDAALPV